MTIWKKAISVATSAALLASLLATAVAPSAFAAITVGSAGNVPVGGTSASEVSFTFTEQGIASLGNLAGSSYMEVTILDSAGAATVSFTGTPSVAGSTGSLGASAAIFGNVLRITIGGSDTLNKESIFITGLKIKATSLAATGAITATITAATNEFGATPAAAAAVFSGGGTATGTIVGGIGIGATSVIVNVTSAGCNFSDTATSGNPLSFATSAETKNITTASALGDPAAGQQTLAIVATVNVHNAGEVVSEATGCGASPTLASPGTVVVALVYSADDNWLVYPGEFNSPAAPLQLVEPTAGTLAKDSTFTYKIATAGVVFSTAPRVDVTGGVGMTLSQPVLSADRLSATVTVTAVSTTAATIRLTSILYDVAASVAPGTFISVGVTTSAGKAVQPASNTNAVVFRGVVAVSATSPTVYIGENNQTAGVVSFTESAAGFFTAGVGTGVNTFEICQSGVGYSFTLAPYAQVVGGVAAGNLILRDGSAASTTNLVQGTLLTSGCYRWTIWTASTTASTIKIGGAGLTSGPLINVNTGQAPGGVNVALYIGSADFLNRTLAATVQFATATYRNQVAVTALSQPKMAPGATNAAAGNLQIAETGLGQLKVNEVICVEVLWRSGELQDQFLNSLNTADLPLATASGTGLVISPVNYSQSRCGTFNVDGYNPAVPAGYMQSFTFTVLQQSTAGDGKIVISNMRYTVLTDTAEGPVQLSVWGTGGSPTNVIFHSTVSNATVGAQASISIGAVSALGLNPTSGYSAKTPKTQAVGKYVTWKFTGGTALAGQRVNILVATKINGAWGGPKYFISRWADANGIVTFTWKSATAKAINVRVQWPGNANYTVSTSKALGAYWK